MNRAKPGKDTPTHLALCCQGYGTAGAQCAEVCEPANVIVLRGQSDACRNGARLDTGA
jgi:hypothetical protein